jgi:hypothetical protein
VTVRRALTAVALAATLASGVARCFLALAAFARQREGAASLGDALGGSTGLWHALAVEAPLRTLAPLVAVVVALRLFESPRARDGAALGAIASLAALAVQSVVHPAPHALFAAVIAVSFGAAIGAGAAEAAVDPSAGSPLVFAWLAHSGAIAAMLTTSSARARSAVLLSALATLAVTAAHAYLQRERRRLRDDVEATLSLASRTLQSLTPWHLRGEGVRHLSLRWLAFAVFTTLGLIFFACAMAVVSGHALGLDFATFEQDEGAASSDLAFVAAFILAAFALSGWLLGRVTALRAMSESILGPLMLVPVVVVALPTGRSDFLFSVALALVAALLTAAGAVMARRTSA